MPREPSIIRRAYTPSAHRPVPALALLALSQVLAMTLWFSATAVLPS